MKKSSPKNLWAVSRQVFRRVLHNYRISKLRQSSFYTFDNYLHSCIHAILASMENVILQQKSHLTLKLSYIPNRTALSNIQDLYQDISYFHSCHTHSSLNPRVFLLLQTSTIVSIISVEMWKCFLFLNK